MSVCGTGTIKIKFSGFSWEYVYTHYYRFPRKLVYCQVRLLSRICLGQSTSTPFNGLFRQSAALSLLRLHVTLNASTGILTCSAIGITVRLSLRTRLTLIRLALIRKPWSCGGRVSLPPYRYLCLHLLFHKLHHALRHGFGVDGMLPYHSVESIASAIHLMPVYYPRTTARLVSCYALFK